MSSDAMSSDAMSSAGPCATHTEPEVHESITTPERFFTRLLQARCYVRGARPPDPVAVDKLLQDLPDPTGLGLPGRLSMPCFLCLFEIYKYLGTQQFCEPISLAPVGADTSLDNFLDEQLSRPSVPTLGPRQASMENSDAAGDLLPVDTEALHKIPRLRLAQDFRCVHEDKPEARTRSSRRLSSRRSSEGSRFGTCRTLRSVHLNLDPDTESRSTQERKHTCTCDTVDSQLMDSLRIVSARQPGQQLHMLAWRAAGTFFSRRSSGNILNLRLLKFCQVSCEGRLPATWPPSSNTQHSNQTTQRRVLCLLSRLVTYSRFDVETLKFPLNTLVRDALNFGALDAEANRQTRLWTRAVVHLCIAIGVAIEKVRVATPVHSTSAAIVAPASWNTIGCIRQESTSSKLAPHCAPDKDKFLLRLSCRLKTQLRAPCLDTVGINRLLELCCEYCEHSESRPCMILQPFQLLLDLVLQLLRRIATGAVFDSDSDPSIACTIHWILSSLHAVSNAGNVARASSFRRSTSCVKDTVAVATTLLINDRDLLTWTASYCCWALSNTGHVGANARFQAIAFLLQCAANRHDPLPQSWVHSCTNTGGIVHFLFDSRQSILVEHLQDNLVPSNQHLRLCRIAALLYYIVEIFRHKNHCQNLQKKINFEGVANAVFLTFIHAYFHCDVVSPALAELCCLALEAALSLIECNSTICSGMAQARRMMLVEALLGDAEWQPHDYHRLHIAHSVLSVHFFSGIDNHVLSTGGRNRADSELSSYLLCSVNDFSESSSDACSGSPDLDTGESSSEPTPVSKSGFNLSAKIRSQLAPMIFPVHCSIRGRLINNPSARPPRMYQSGRLHGLALSLLFNLLINCDSLSSVNWSTDLISASTPNIHRVLYGHLNYHAKVVENLSEALRDVTRQTACNCLFKLLCARMFNSLAYTDRTRIATGAYATVYKCSTRGDGRQIAALKAVDMVNSSRFACSLSDVFSEIRILSLLQGCTGVCELFDYGIGRESYYISMRCHMASLRKWRTHHASRQMFDDRSPAMTALYLRIYHEIVKAVQSIAALRVAHFDIKCDNVLISPAINFLGGFWEPASLGMFPAYTVVLADFGVASVAGDKPRKLNDRGTECIKSPELLMADRADSAASSFDRRRATTSAAACDVWSLGCLLFELVVGMSLFDGSDFAQLFVRICTGCGPVLTDSDRHKLNASCATEILDYVLIRNPSMRPTVDDVCRYFDFLLLQNAHSSIS